MSQRAMSQCTIKQRGDDPPSHDQPAWAVDAGIMTSFWRGTRAFYQLPAVVLFFTALGYGAFARDVGLSFGQTVFLSLSIFALPGQVVLVDQVAQGAGLAATAFAVTLTAIRLLPTTAVLVPYLRAEGTSKWLLLLGSHFIAVTAWVVGMRALPFLPRRLRLAHHMGIGCALISAVTAASAIGHELAQTLPTVLAAVLLFLTPIYFLLSLLAAAAIRSDQLAIAFGIILGPLAFLIMPGFDLLATGLVGGTAAYLIGRMARA